MIWLLGVLCGAVVAILVAAVVKPVSDRLAEVSDRLWGAPALFVHVEHDPRLIWANMPPWVGFAYCFEDGLPLEPPPSVAFDSWQWARRNGGVNMGISVLQVTLQARSGVSVVIEDVLARNVRRNKSGGVGVVFPAGGASLCPRRFDVDLDAWSPPIVEFRVGADADPIPAPSFQLAPGETERFHIWVRARHGWNDWSVQLPLLVNGRRQYQDIGTEAKPFTTVGSDVPTASYMPGRDGTWLPFEG